MTPAGSDPQLELTTAQADVVQKAVRYWPHYKLVSSELVGDLLSTVQVVEEEYEFDWGKFAKYTFRLAVICLAVAREVDKRKNLHILHNIELFLAVVYGLSAVLVQSNFIWSCSMVALGIWLGS
ncbi:hypothetical protein CIB48_g10037 [Xylaria polymorpha]|nr:hypothetical protein CIB48_g10037 [Xylaria polymorpha]